jgi:choline kinase
MSLLIAVPIHGGGKTPFWKSLMRLQETFLVSGLDHEFLIMENESLVQRARNNCVTTFLETEFERLLFIDSDIEFEPEDVQKLWNMNEDVAVGCYAMKRKDQPVTAWKNGNLVDLSELDQITEIDYAGTGFMMIKREVFEAMRSWYSERVHHEGKPTENVHDHRISFAYFDPRVEGGVYLSEDYAFCDDVKCIGKKIMLDPSIKLIHWGDYGYGA